MSLLGNDSILCFTLLEGALKEQLMIKYISNKLHSATCSGMTQDKNDMSLSQYLIILYYTVLKSQLLGFTH